MLAVDVGFDGVVPTSNLSHSTFDRVTLHLVNFREELLNNLSGFSTWFYVPKLGAEPGARCPIPSFAPPSFSPPFVSRLTSHILRLTHTHYGYPAHIYFVVAAIPTHIFWIPLTHLFFVAAIPTHTFWIPPTHLLFCGRHPPSFLPSFRPSPVLPSFLPTFLPSFLLLFLPSFIIYVYANTKPHACGVY